MGGGIEANPVAERLSVTPYFEDVGTTCKPKKTAKAPAGAAYPPRRAHDTLQPQDESIIVGYYTFAKVSLRNATLYNTNKTQEVNAYGKRRWYPSYKCKKRKIS